MRGERTRSELREGESFLVFGRTEPATLFLKIAAHPFDENDGPSEAEGSQSEKILEEPTECRAWAAARPTDPGCAGHQRTPFLPNAA